MGEQQDRLITQAAKEISYDPEDYMVEDYDQDEEEVAIVGRVC